MTSAASVLELAEPICLVENQAGQGLAVRQDALQVLANVTQPVVVVAITGLYRSGKSYLLNRLAGRRTGEGRGGMGTADPACPRCRDSPPLRFTLPTPASPTQVSPWAPMCRVTPKESGCGACLTPASPDTRWCCWTPKGWETWRRSGRSSAFPLSIPSARGAVGRAACTASAIARQRGSGGRGSPDLSCWPLVLGARGFAPPPHRAAAVEPGMAIAGGHQERRVDLCAGRAALQHPDLQQQGHHRPAGPGEPAVSLAAAGIPHSVPSGLWALHSGAPPSCLVVGHPHPRGAQGLPRGLVLRAEPSSQFP